MLVMTNELQKFIDSQVKETSEETLFFVQRQIRKFIEQDPDGEFASAIIEKWFNSTEEPTEVGDRVSIKFACHVVKALTIRQYIRESKPMSYWALVNMYEYGTFWQKQTSAGEIAYRVSKASSEQEYQEWLEKMSNLDTSAEIDFLLSTPEQFPGLTS